MALPVVPRITKAAGDLQADTPSWTPINEYQQEYRSPFGRAIYDSRGPMLAGDKDGTWRGNQYYTHPDQNRPFALESEFNYPSMDDYRGKEDELKRQLVQRITPSSDNPTLSIPTNGQMLPEGSLPWMNPRKYPKEWLDQPADLKQFIPGAKRDKRFGAAASTPYDKFFQSLVNKDPEVGFSYNPVHNTQPTERYMVSVPQGEAVVPADKMTPEEIEKHVDLIKNMLANPNMFQGGWLNHDDNNVYLDASEQYPDLQSAMDAGKKNNQYAIFDRQTGQSIPVPDSQRSLSAAIDFEKAKNEDGEIDWDEIESQKENKKESSNRPKFVRAAALPSWDNPYATPAHPGLATVKDKWMQSSNSGPRPTRRTDQQGAEESSYYMSQPEAYDHPEMQKSYKALSDALVGQYNDLRGQGFSYEPYDKEGEPYANSDEMRADLAKGHMYYRPTDINGDLQENHPMRQTVNTVDGPMMLNDVFRNVHDQLGHGFGASFGPLGEQQAWMNHRETLPAAAHPALYTETRGQNVYTNYGNSPEYGEHSKLPVAQRPFGPQRVVWAPQYS